MKTAVIRNSWMQGYGYRLDTKPYVGGALQTKILLEKLPMRKDPLHTLTKGHDGGIYNGPQFSRNYVDDPENGVPFLTGSSMQLADLSTVSLLSRKDALGKKLKHLRLERCMTLISCSGSIGKMAYVRPEMAGIWSSQDILKVVPDPSKIPSGYLYAFLSSKFGVPLVASGTYGAIIQHLEPEHIAGIDIPRLVPAKEQEIHELVEEAARLRSEASFLRSKAIDHFEKIIEWIEQPQAINSCVSFSSSLHKRMDAHFHSARSTQGRNALEFNGSNQHLSDMCSEIYSPDRGPRKKVEAEEHGVPFISSSAIFHADPKPDYFISNNSAKLDSFLVNENDLLIPRSGSLGGVVIGRAVLPVPQIYGNAATEQLVHVRCNKKQDAYFLWAVFTSRPGYQAILSTAFGSAIPSLDSGIIGTLKVPLLKPFDYTMIVDYVSRSLLCSQQAIESERSAICILENELTAKRLDSGCGGSRITITATRTGNECGSL